MEIKIVKINQVKPNPENPRIIKDDKFRKLVKSIQEFPKMLEIRPIVVNDDMIVLGGNMRLKACKEAGLKELPVIMASDLTEDQQREFIIKDNVGFGEWDWDDLANNWNPDQLTDWGLDIPDFAVQEVEAVEDDYEMPNEIKSDFVLGDLIEIGPHRLLCGDSTNPDHFDKLFNGNKIDLVFTDPPYGISVVDKKGKIGQANLTKQGIYKPIIGDDTTNTAKEFYQSCQSFNIQNYIIWGGNYFTDFLPPKACWIIWDKKGDMLSNNFADGEMAWTSFDSPVRLKKHIWRGMIKEGENSKRVHPTQKPIKLCADLINEYIEGQNVFDGFGGSGSTMVACHEIKKTCFMIEMSADYIQTIVDRMVKLDPTLTVKVNGKEYVKTTE